VKLYELTPGNMVEIPSLGRSVFVGMISPHPLYPDLALVIWRMDNGTWSLDALLPGLELPDATEVTGRTPTQRDANLRAALLNGRVLDGALMDAADTSPARAYGLLEALRNEVQRLVGLDRSAAVQVMGEVAGFESNWWIENASR
jgi:hypothetical protein